MSVLGPSSPLPPLSPTSLLLTPPPQVAASKHEAEKHHKLPPPADTPAPAHAAAAT